MTSDLFTRRTSVTLSAFLFSDGIGTLRYMKGSKRVLFLWHVRHFFSALSWPWKRSTMTEQSRLR